MLWHAMQFFSRNGRTDCAKAELGPPSPVAGGGWATILKTLAPAHSRSTSAQAICAVRLDVTGFVMPNMTAKYIKVLCAQVSVRSRFSLHAIDHNYPEWQLFGLKLESELLFERGKNGRPIRRLG